MVTAFIPVRGGSKSIPLKNIRPFLGKPLVWWNLRALEECPGVDRVVVATDSDEIEAAVREAGFSKTVIYRRSAANASDTASTESVMLEYIGAASLPEDEVFMLVQATSPLTRTEDFEGGLRLLREGGYDSVLSCVRSKRFFWNPDGTSADTVIRGILDIPENYNVLCVIAFGHKADERQPQNEDKLKWENVHIDKF